MPGGSKLKLLVPGVLLLLGGILAAWLLLSPEDPRRDAPEKGAVSTGALPRLVGSWFVRYASDPVAYLDVAVEAPAGVKLSKVTAHLTGPGRTYPDIELRYNPKDDEWQLARDPLPTPLAGGTWWVSQVGLFLEDGRWLRYHADDPYGTYLVDRGARGGPTVKDEKSKVWIGSFYATEQDAERPHFTVHTFPAPGGKKSNPTLQIYRAGDPARWIAVNDDPDVNQDYARVSLPLTPGQTYLIRVDDRYHELGDYCLQVNRSATPSGEGRAAPAGTHPGEPDDEPGKARVLAQGEVRCLTFTPREGIWGDQDWLSFTAPTEEPP